MYSEMCNSCLFTQLGGQIGSIRQGSYSCQSGGRYRRVSPNQTCPFFCSAFEDPPFSKLGGQALVLDVEGTWRELTGVVNKLAANLTNQVRSIAKVTKAVALGDLSKQIDVDARGEILDLKNTVNGMVIRLRALAAEVTRVTLEVGSQGKLGGKAHVPDVEGVWFELVRNVSYRGVMRLFDV